MRVGAWGSVCGFLLTVAAPSVLAQQSATLRVEETEGIRRTQFPTRTRLEVPSGLLPSANAIRLTAGDVEIPIQGTRISGWDDGTVRMLELDFNVSIGPFDTTTFTLSYGPDVAPTVEPRRGLSVVDEDGALQVGRVRLNRIGSPLLLSVDYRGELVVEGGNGVVVLDDTGMRHAASEVVWEPVEVVKAGPLIVHLRYRGDLALRGGAAAEVVIDAEMPNSKSWVRLAVTVTDAARSVRGVTLETPLSTGEYPWTWDFGTRNGTYGAIRNANASVILTQRIYSDTDASWRIATGTLGEERPYEVSVPGRADLMRGWMHLVGEREAVAFAIEGIGESPGTFRATLNGEGQTAFGFEPLEPTIRHTLTVYQHYVSTPVPIGAATSPASILSPLRVTID